LAPSSSKPLWCSSVQPLRRWRSAQTAAVRSSGRIGMYAQSKKSVLKKVVAHPFLDRRKAAPMAMSVDQTGHSGSRRLRTPE
jgi:hypothetical protein